MATTARAESRSPPGLTLEEIDDAAALEALAADWGALLDADPEASPFQSPEWLLAWRRAFLRRDTLWVLALRRGPVLAGLGAFFIHRAADGSRQLTLMGNGLSDRQDLLARPQDRSAAAAAVGRRIAERRDWDRADFRDLPDGSPFLTMQLGDGLKERVEPEAPCPTLRLHASPVAALPKSRRGDLRRCARRLQETAPLRFLRTDRGRRRAHLDALVRLHGARWRAQGQAGVLSEEAVTAFHEEATRGLEARGWLRLEVLAHGERIIAAHYGLRRGERGYSYLHAFDPALAAFGPGWLLMAHSLDAAWAEGVRTFDFLRGAEAYKYAWGARDRPQWRRRVWR